MMTTSGFHRFWMHRHSMLQHATHNIDMAKGHEEEGKLAHERLQFALPVRAKTQANHQAA
jgi:hypothetical protein